MKNKNIPEVEKATAAIGLKGKNGLISVITLDKYASPGFAGAMLVSKYQDVKKVEELINLGNIHLLGENVKAKPNYPHCIRASEVLAENEEGSITQKFKVPLEAYYGAGCPDYIYIFDSITKKWTTYGVDDEIGFTKLKIQYKRFIQNLIDRDDITELTQDEKKYLDKCGY